MDQRRETCDPVDARILSLVQRERRSHQLHPLAYNLGNFLRTFWGSQDQSAERSLITLCEKLVKIGARSSATAATRLSDGAGSDPTTVVRSDRGENRCFALAAGGDANLNDAAPAYTGTTGDLRPYEHAAGLFARAGLARASPLGRTDGSAGRGLGKPPESTGTGGSHMGNPDLKVLCRRRKYGSPAS